VVAEGVETDTQLARVQELGCDLVQGYLFSKAVPPDQLTRLLRADPWRRVLTIHG
jgi:EAL domain-containing protein (putative c-di-GMP-specific phosphodiesterase class I)